LERAVADLLLELPDGHRVRPALEDQLRTAIRRGQLRPGVRLPSSRALASQLGVSRGVITETYSQLIAEGYLLGKHGSGTTVASLDGRRRRSTGATRSPSPGVLYDFHPGLPDLEQFPRMAWSRAVRKASECMPTARLGYDDGAGAPELRDELASFLGMSRGVRTEAGSVMITAGFTQAFALVCRALVRAGARAIAIEDPGFFLTSAIAKDAGLDVLPVPVDDDGISVERLAETGADAVVVTPAHQAPTGVVLAPSRRSALLDWAQSTKSLIIEDDYDAEFRYDRRPVGSLHGVSPDLVMYVGSASKVLAPALRIGWAVLPERMRGPMLRAKRLADGGCAILEQLALAAFIGSGDFARHLHRMRRHYARRRRAFIDAVSSSLPDAEIRGIEAGLSALVLLRTDVNELSVITDARDRGIRLAGLGEHYAHRRSARPGLVLGFAASHERRLEEGISLLASVVASE